MQERTGHCLHLRNTFNVMALDDVPAYNSCISTRARTCKYRRTRRSFTIGGTRTFWENKSSSAKGWGSLNKPCYIANPCIYPNNLVCPCPLRFTSWTEGGLHSPWLQERKLEEARVEPSTLYYCPPIKLKRSPKHFTRVSCLAFRRSTIFLRREAEIFSSLTRWNQEETFASEKFKRKLERNFVTRALVIIGKVQSKFHRCILIILW